ncbi:MAG TPA: periplasmic heavy metal sensor [Candidatus Aerophobetes bacterium]|uniref:Periplasmic heavy metal sensor n=1 Tax=Aerophobetes bacterium TaxID=2030807 RepID=A0A7V0QSQ8_UNCAE|nr:periplasmic heavy metal sensor [Candidatus Aerophobetes bacterium]
MDKIKKIVVGTLVVLLLLSSIGVAFAEGPQGKKAFPQAPRAYRTASYYSLVTNLNLSQDQIRKLRDLRLEYQKETLELRNTLRVKKLELQTLLASKDVNEEKANSIVDEIGKLRTNIWEKTIHYQLEMRKVLTQEQWDKLLSYRYMWSKGGKGSRRGRGGRKAWFGPLP